MIRRFIVALILSILVMVGMAMPVLAIIDPDSPPAVNAVYIYEDLIEDGDTGVLIDYYLDYSVSGNPTETVTEAYLLSFIDIDGITQLKTVAPYTFQDSGYGRGLIWIYFTATETTTYSLDSADVALYSVWFMGNPTLAWAGDPPKTTATIDYWQTSGDASILLALRVLYYADQLELIWVPALDLIETTSLGSRLTTTGESYFENVIASLRVMAPNCFSAGEYSPVMEDTDYATEFGAIATSTVLAASPVDLAEGANALNPTGAGTIVFTLLRGTVGTAVGATVVGTPLALVEGNNTATITGIGAITVTVNLENTQTAITDTITGTGLDLTTVATHFGMSRLMFSGLVWLVVSIIICAAVYKVGEESNYGGSGKVVMIVFDLCIIGGAVLGLLSIIAAVLLFIGFGAFTGYVLFFRGANV